MLHYWYSVIQWKSNSRDGLVDGRYCYCKEGKARNADKKEYRKSIDSAKRVDNSLYRY